MDTPRFWGSYRGAASLTFDDGDPSQLQKAIPAMDNAGIKGTFYLAPKGSSWEKNLAPWVEVAKRGHEIGNHTLSHICSNNLWGSTGGLEEKTLAEIEADILAAQERLVRIAPHQDQWTFCYPCYESHVGMGASRQSYVPVVAKHFLAGRGWGEYGFGNWPAMVDLAYVRALPMERKSGFEMIGLVEGIASKGCWVVLVFHEIDGSRLTTASYDFRMLIEYLERRRDEIWVAPVVEVAKKIMAERSGEPG